MSKELDSVSIFPEWVTQETKHNPDPLFTAYQALTHWHRNNVCRQLETILNQTSVDMKDDEREEWLERTKVAPQFVHMTAFGHDNQYFESINHAAKAVHSWLTDLATRHTLFCYVTESGLAAYNIWRENRGESMEDECERLQLPVTMKRLITLITQEHVLNVQYRDTTMEYVNSIDCHYTQLHFEVVPCKRQVDVYINMP